MDLFVVTKGEGLILKDLWSAVRWPEANGPLGGGWRPWEGRRRPLFEQEEEEEEVIEEVEAIFEAFCPTSSPTLSVISLSSNPPTVHSPEYSPEIHFVLCHFPLWRPERALAFPVKKIVSVFIFSFLCLVYCLEIAKGVHLLEKRLEHLRWSLLDRQRGSVKILQYHSDWIKQNLLSHMFFNVKLNFKKGLLPSIFRSEVFLLCKIALLV